MVYIYKIGNKDKQFDWKLEHTLDVHDKEVSVIDWSVKNKLLTGSHDRNCIVH